MRTRRDAALLAALILAMALTGCGGKERAEVLYLNGRPEQKEQWEALAREYTRQSGVPVRVITESPGLKGAGLESRLAGLEPPTLFWVEGPMEMESWGKYCWDLSQSQLCRQLKSEDFTLREEGRVLAVAYGIESYGLIYNREILRQYCRLEGAVIGDASEIRNFETLKAVAEDMQSRREELGIQGAFASAGMEASSAWRFQSHLANLPLYYEYQDEGIYSARQVQGSHLDNFRQIWDLYLHNSTVPPALIAARTGDDAAQEFAQGQACFYQNGTWAYEQISGGEVADEDIGMLPLYIGAEGEENQGLVTGSENYWCVNRQASAEEIQASLDFLEWVITSQEGRRSLSQQMGLVTPFKTFGEEYTPDNPLVQAAEECIRSGRTSVGWCFTTMPSQRWKEELGRAMLRYAQGIGSWPQVEEAFREGWAREYQARE